jgi:hypothetical protein
MALEQGTQQKTRVAPSVPRAIALLRADPYDVLVLDQSILECDARALDTILNNSGLAMPVYVNLALHGAERVVREVQMAFRRGEHERLLAMRTAEALLRSQFRSEVTSILLNSEMVLREPALPVHLAAKIRNVQQSAEKMRSFLER